MNTNYINFKPEPNGFINESIYALNILRNTERTLREYEPCRIISYTINQCKHYIDGRLHRKYRKQKLIEIMRCINYKNKRK